MEEAGELLDWVTEEVIKLTPEGIDLLLTLCELGRWHVTETNLCDVADLVRLECATLNSDYDTISVFVTDQGKNYASKRKWIEPFPDAVYEPWMRTELGKQASNFIADRT